jgi:hypothetical protein
LCTGLPVSANAGTSTSQLQHPLAQRCCWLVVLRPGSPAIGPARCCCPAARPGTPSRSRRPPRPRHSLPFSGERGAAARMLWGAPPLLQHAHALAPHEPRRHPWWPSRHQQRSWPPLRPRRVGHSVCACATRRQPPQMPNGNPPPPPRGPGAKGKAARRNSRGFTR